LQFAKKLKKQKIMSKTKIIFSILWLISAILVIVFYLIDMKDEATVSIILMWIFWIGMLTSKYIDNFINKFRKAE
jgi:type IV secretory pathway VirB3-like protein